MKDTIIDFPTNRFETRDLIFYGATSIMPDEHHGDRLLALVNTTSFYPERTLNFASIIAAVGGSRLYEEPIQAIHLFADGSTIYYREGVIEDLSNIIGLENEEPHMFAIKEPFLELVKGLRGCEVQDDEIAQYSEPVPSSCGKDSRYQVGAQGACLALNIARLWNEMEQRKMSWWDRHWMLFDAPGNADRLLELQEFCFRMGLVEGSQAPLLDQKLASLERAVRILEANYWEAVKSHATEALEASGM